VVVVLISQKLAVKLLNMSQTVLSNLEMGKTFEAKCKLLQMSAIIAVETDRNQEIQKWGTDSDYS